MAHRAMHLCVLQVTIQRKELLGSVAQTLSSLATPWWQGRFCTAFISQTYLYQTPITHLAPGWALKPRKVSLIV